MKVKDVVALFPASHEVNLCWDGNLVPYDRELPGLLEDATANYRVRMVRCPRENKVEIEIMVRPVTEE